jgi:hypothetical protein
MDKQYSHQVATTTRFMHKQSSLFWPDGRGLFHRKVPSPATRLLGLAVLLLLSGALTVIVL